MTTASSANTEKPAEISSAENPRMANDACKTVTLTFRCDQAW
jgi:hypothetical protein